MALAPAVDDLESSVDESGCKCLFARRSLEKSRRGTVFMERLIREYECVVEPGAGLFTNRASNSMNTY
jgi:hypothetical protein